MLIPCGTRVLDCTEPKVMAVLNVTPDSFFDGGNLFERGAPDKDRVLQKVATQINEGADIIDVGGESTRPGAAEVTTQQELDRVVPVVELVAERFDTVISVDTSNPEVMLQAAQAGAGMINDVRALEKPGALQAAASTNLSVCLMHMQGAPQTMQEKPQYDSVVQTVSDYLLERKKRCLEHGIGDERILVDPGIGFGKTDEHNLALLKHIDTFKSLAPVLIGVSRKSMFGRLLGRDLDQRLAGSLAVALMSVQQGASIVRVHDVAATRDVIKMWQLLR